MLVLRNQIHLLAETRQIGHEQISTLKVSAVILQLNLMSISDKKSDLQTRRLEWSWKRTFAKVKVWLKWPIIRDFTFKNL